MYHFYSTCISIYIVQNTYFVLKEVADQGDNIQVSLVPDVIFIQKAIKGNPSLDKCLWHLTSEYEVYIQYIFSIYSVYIQCILISLNELTILNRLTYLT